VVKGDARAAKQAYLEMAPGEKINRGALLLDIKAVLYDIHRSNLTNVSIGEAFNSLLRAGSKHGVHNPPEFFLLTRAFVILESMIRELDPDHNYLQSFREEVSRLTAKHFSAARIKEKTVRLARDLERLISDAPNDTRRALRRFGEGNLGRVQAPALEALGGRLSRNLERLTSAMATSALMIGGALLVNAPLGGWHHYLGEGMVVSGIVGGFLLLVATLRRDKGRR